MAFDPITIPESQKSFFGEVLQGEQAKRKIISRTRITLTPIANPFSRANFERLRDIEAQLLTNPTYQQGGLEALKSFDRRTYNEYNRLSTSFNRAVASKAQPGFFAIQRSVATP